MEAQGDVHQEPTESDDGDKQYFRRIHLICDDVERDDAYDGLSWFSADKPVKPAWRTVTQRTPRKQRKKTAGLHIDTSQLPPPDPRAQVASWATWQRRLVYFHVIYHYAHFFGFFQRILTRLRLKNPLCSHQVLTAQDFSFQDRLRLRTQGLK